MMKSFINNPQNFAKSVQLIRAAGRPYMFNKDFLIEAGLTESSAVLYNNLFIALGLVEANGKPGKDYGRFLQSEEESKIVISEKIWEKYTEVFAEERHAYDLPVEKISEIFKKVYGDEHSDSFVNLLASTFKALVNYAGLNSIKKAVSPELVAADEHVNGVSENVFDEDDSKSIEDDTDTVEVQEHEHNLDNETAEESAEEIPFEIEAASGIISDEGPEPGLSDTNSESEKGSKNKDTDHLMDLINETPKIKDEKKDNNMDTDVLNNGADHREKTAEKNDAFLKKALMKRVELLQKLNRDEEAIEALNQLVEFFENSDEPDKEEVLSKSLIQKAEILEKLGNDEETLEAYDKYINRYFK
jgi:tetratricopeptide (TPR) repeat protein